ncbi:MAG: dienelactone hydrolase [Verrucomicrobiota bacterium]
MKKLPFSFIPVLRLPFVFLFLFCSIVFGKESAYNPLSVSTSFKPETIDLVIQDQKRNREIPLRIYFPAETGPHPVILFSHGLGGSSENSPYLGNHWAARGYLAVFMQHHGSDEALWKEKTALHRITSMREGISLKNFLLRTQDVPVVMDQLEKWNQQKSSPLFGRLDLQHLGMTGHSFGAVTTQAVSGQTFLTGSGYTDSRIKAALAMSPNAPHGEDPKAAFGKVQIPWMLMTGTKDTIGWLNRNLTLDDRLAVYPALPAGDKYEIVLHGAEHSAFGDRPLTGDKEPRNPNHHRVILALSTAFWDSYLKGDPAAKSWLQGNGPAQIIESKDHWQWK